MRFISRLFFQWRWWINSMLWTTSISWSINGSCCGRYISCMKLNKQKMFFFSFRLTHFVNVEGVSSSLNCGNRANKNWTISIKTCSDVVHNNSESREGDCLRLVRKSIYLIILFRNKYENMIEELHRHYHWSFLIQQDWVIKNEELVKFSLKQLHHFLDLFG